MVTPRGDISPRRSRHLCGGIGRAVSWPPRIVPMTQGLHAKETRWDQRGVHVRAREAGCLPVLHVQRVEGRREEFGALFVVPTSLIGTERCVRRRIVERAPDGAVVG